METSTAPPDLRRTPRPVVAVIVDDDEDMRELLSAALELDGSQVISFADGKTALDYLRGCPRKRFPDLIITDLAMPGYSGFRFMNELREIGPDGSGHVVVAITGFGDAETHDVAHRLGARVSLDKPVDVSRFRALVRDLAA